jgi:lysophospholipase L1-like esterase
MKRTSLFRLSPILLKAVAVVTVALCVLPVQALEPHFYGPADPHIQYVGRISFLQPDRPQFNYPGTQINVAFEGTTLQLLCKPRSGYFMACVDGAEPFKVAFRNDNDSVVTLCADLPYGRHQANLMYCVEGYELHPEFRGVMTDGKLTAPDPLPSRHIEFVGNSITCGYGNEETNPASHFSYETENHYYSYAQLTARQLNAVAYIVARSGMGAYRNYNGPRTGNPDNNIHAQYEYTLYAERSAFRKAGGSMGEKWNFELFRPDVVCINLGTNDLSTPNYDTDLLKKHYHQLLQTVRKNNPSAKIVFLTGVMLDGKELNICRNLLNEVTQETRQSGDREVYRVDMTPQGALGYGADYHPSLLQHQKMASELTVALRWLMKW